MTRILPALLLLGCGDSVEKGWRRTLDACGQLTLLGWSHKVDGTICFSFGSDAGGEFVVKAVPRNVGQELRLLGDGIPGETEIRPGSALESRLAVLLENCRFEAYMKYIAREPSPQARDWLLGRLRNRDIPWGPCP